MKHFYLLVSVVFGVHGLWGETVTDGLLPSINVRTTSFQEDGSYEQDERLLNTQPIIDGERHMVVLICSYNNERYYEWNLDSVCAQEYKNYHVIYVNDCSGDNTGCYVMDYIDQRGVQDKIIVYHNHERRKALANLYYAIHLCQPTDIIVILDGDDHLAHPHVLDRINQEYADPGVWLTYGQFREYPTGAIGFCKPYPQSVIDRCGFRYYPDTPSHLRTFYAGLFHKIRKEDLMFQGDFFPTTYDLAIMFPMIEMARLHHKFIPDILLDYNGANPINDHKGGGKQLQRKFDLIIRARTCYADIESLF